MSATTPTAPFAPKPSRAARAARPIQRLPIGSGIAACAALAWVLARGPEPSAIVPAVLLAGSGVGFGAALLRRAFGIARGGEPLIVLVGLLTLALIGVLWLVTAFIGGAQLALAVWLWTFGLLLASSRLGRLRAREHRPRTPWQVIGEARAGEDVRATLVDLSGLLAGAILLVLGTGLGVDWLLMRISGLTGAFGSLTSLLFAVTVPLLATGLLVGGFGWLWLAGRRNRRPLVGASRGAQVPLQPAARHDAEVAAHLHDSVLQTLALIGRSANDPARVQQLARQQERSLRAWLAGRDEASATSLAGAIRVAAQEVEDEQPGARIEVVAVGDAPLDRLSDALVRAAREAMRNAVRHAGSPVRVFVEVEGTVREVFVRDTGAGFDLAQIAEERRGVRDAIIGRMEHVGGSATIESGADGTEIALRVDDPAI